MPTVVEAFKCDWCGRCFGRKNNARQHEAACCNNPSRHHCKTCVHGVYFDNVPVYSPLTVQSYMPGADNAPEIYCGPYCDHHKQPIYKQPYYIDCDMSAHCYGGPEHEAPGTCEHYEYKGKAEWTRPPEVEV